MGSRSTECVGNLPFRKDEEEGKFVTLFGGFDKHWGIGYVPNFDLF
jgi:hypothetical protein